MNDSEKQKDYLAQFMEAAECYRAFPENERPLVGIQVIAAADRVLNLEEALKRIACGGPDIDSLRAKLVNECPDPVKAMSRLEMSELAKSVLWSCLTSPTNR